MLLLRATLNFLRLLLTIDVVFSSQALKASPGAIIVAGVAIANPIQTVVAGAVAKTLLDSKFRSNSSKFLQKQADLKKKVEQVIASSGIDGLLKRSLSSNNLTVMSNLKQSISCDSLLNKLLEKIK